MVIDHSDLENAQSGGVPETPLYLNLTFFADLEGEEDFRINPSKYFPLSPRGNKKRTREPTEQYSGVSSFF
jgi:hypothetical protein